MKLKNFFLPIFLKGGLLVLFANLLGGFLNYLYHFLAGKFLVPSDYGLLESLMSLIYFLAVLNEAFAFSIIRFTSKMLESKIFLLTKNLELIALKISLVISLIFIFIFPFLQKFLHLNSFLFLIIFLTQVFTSFLTTVYLGILRAKFKFFSFSLIGISQSFIKLLVSFFFFLLGYKISGALISWLVAGFFALFLGKRFILNYWPSSSPKPIFTLNKLKRRFWQYSSLTLLTNLSLTSIFSSDILLVRYFFSTHDSGIYAAVSVLGRMIFFPSTSYLLVAFPLFTKFKNNLKKLKIIFLNVFLLFFLTFCFGWLIFNSFSKTLISFFYRQDYFKAELFLPSFIFFIALYAFFTYLIQFLLALEKKSAAYLSFLIAVLQIFLIIFRHLSLSQIINNSTLTLIFGIFLGLFLIIKLFYEKK